MFGTGLLVVIVSKSIVSAPNLTLQTQKSHAGQRFGMTTDCMINIKT